MRYDIPGNYNTLDTVNDTHGISNYTIVSDNDTMAKFVNLSIRITTTTNPSISMYTGPPPKGLPVPLLIASPVAAVCILIFVCIAYYCHALQLDSRARELSMKMASQDVEVEMTKSITETSVLSTCENEVIPKKKNTIAIKTPSPCQSFASLKPPGRSPRPSMNWGTFGDQDVLAFSASRRHSTFLI